MHATDTQTTGTDDLTRLAAELSARGCKTVLSTGEGRQPRLDVSNPRAALLSETVYVADGAFCWSWQEPIAPVADVSTAAGILARVLRAVGE
jgi:hypothetical protein